MKYKNLFMVGILILFLAVWVIAEEIAIKAQLTADEIAYLQGEGKDGSLDETASRMISNGIIITKAENKKNMTIEYLKLSEIIKKNETKLSQALIALEPIANPK
jgi:hypothetical protein